MNQTDTTTAAAESTASEQTNEQAAPQASDPQAADVGTVGEATSDPIEPAATSNEATTAVAEQPLASGVTDADVAEQREQAAMQEVALQEIALGQVGGITSISLPVVEMASPAPAPRLVIAPTVGRKVHFYPENGQFHSTPVALGPQPMDATVLYVHDDRMVNLCVTDHIGQVHAFANVTLRQPGDDVPEGQPFAEWMPFQVGQARASV